MKRDLIHTSGKGQEEHSLTLPPPIVPALIIVPIA